MESADRMSTAIMKASFFWLRSVDCAKRHCHLRQCLINSIMRSTDIHTVFELVLIDVHHTVGAFKYL